MKPKIEVKLGEQKIKFQEIEFGIQTKLLLPGMLPIDPLTGLIVNFHGNFAPGAAIRQTIQCLDNLKTILEQMPGYTLDQVLKAVIYLDEGLHEDILNQIIDEIEDRLPNCVFTFALGITNVILGPKVLVQIDPIEIWKGI